MLAECVQLVQENTKYSREGETAGKNNKIFKYTRNNNIKHVARGSGMSELKQNCNQKNGKRAHKCYCLLKMESIKTLSCKYIHGHLAA